MRGDSQIVLSFRSRRTPIVLALMFLNVSVLGCRSIHHADVRTLEGTELAASAVPHCLQTLGLSDVSSEQQSTAEIAEDQTLVAKWVSKRHGSRSYLSATAYVRQSTDHWRVTFIPGPPGSSDSIELFSEGFARCISIHDPGAKVRVDRSRRLDLW